MSHVQHVTVIVTGCNKEILNQAKEKAIELFNEKMVTNIVKSLINQYESFMVCSSGSKDGWDEDIEHQQKIEEYIRYLDSKAYSENKHDNSLQYVVLSYGDSGSKVEKTNQINKFH